VVKRRRFLILLFSFWVLLGHLYAQPAHPKLSTTKSFEHKRFKSNLHIEPRLYFGFIINHHTELEPFNAHMPAFEISVTKDTYGKKYWERLHNYPIIGLSFFYSSLGNNPALGQVYALYPSITFPVIRSEKDFLGFKMGVGLSYITKIFDPLTNYKNIAIGSHVNVAINLMAEYRRKLNKTTDIMAGLSLIHFSNGSIASPNYGLNLPMVSVGFSKRLSEPNDMILLRKPSIPTFSYRDNKIYIFNIMGGYASKNMGNVFGERFDVFILSTNALKYFNEISAIGLQMDFSWDGSHKALLQRKWRQDTSFMQVMRPGIGPVYEMRLSHLIMGFNLGFYFGGKEKSDGDVYEQLNLKYLVYKGAFLNITFRAHGARAAFVSWGIGYRLQYDFGK